MFDDGFSALQIIEDPIDQFHYFSDSSMQYINVDENVSERTTIGGFITGVLDNRTKSMNYIGCNINRINGDNHLGEAAAIDMILNDIESKHIVAKHYIHTDSDAVFESVRKQLKYDRHIDKSPNPPKHMNENFGKVIKRISKKIIRQNQIKDNEIHMDCIKSHETPKRQLKKYKDLDGERMPAIDINYINKGNKVIDRFIGAIASDLNMNFIDEYQL